MAQNIAPQKEEYRHKISKSFQIDKNYLSLQKHILALG